ncbi:MAG: ABC transporter ATP-binding protein [Planctomycetales bacterium]|nr:ABC transporter ATP-binding protein [Planctomycetales bacterium]
MNQRRTFWQVVYDNLAASKLSICCSVVSMIALSVTDLLRPWPLKIIFDSILLEHELPTTFAFLQPHVESDKVFAVVVIASLIVLIAAFRGAFAFVETYHTSKVGNQIAYSLRTRLFAHLQRLPLTYHNSSRRAELLGKIAGDTAAVKGFFSDSALLLGSHVITILGTFVVMFLLNWKLAAVVAATFPILMGNIYFLHQRASTSAKKQRRKEDQLANQISEVLSSIYLVQAFGRQRYEQQRFEEQSQEYMAESLSNARIESAASRAVEITTAFGTFAVVLYGAVLVIQTQMTPGTILVFSSYLHSLYRPIRRLVKISIRLSRLQVSVARINEVLAIEPEIVDRANAIQVQRVRGSIRFDHVAFQYPNRSDAALRNICLQIQPGEHLAIVGASGAGKSTLIGLLLRLYEPSSGRILIDDVDVRDYAVESIRNQISIVMQDSMLLGMSVFDNIAYGELNATNDDVLEAARLACVHDFVLQLPDKYDTIIGERGANLSGGQQRRIAIARAIVRKSPILVLDEPMTGLDAKNAADVKRAIHAVSRNRTTITITHDLHSAEMADRIIVLDRGSIVETGRPSDLRRNSGTYRSLRELGMVKTD